MQLAFLAANALRSKPPLQGINSMHNDCITESKNCSIRHTHVFAASSKDPPQERNTPEHRPAATLAALASFAGLRACANTSLELLAVPIVISDGHKGDGGDFLARAVADEPVA